MGYSKSGAGTEHLAQVRCLTSLPGDLFTLLRETLRSRRSYETDARFVPRGTQLAPGVAAVGGASPRLITKFSPSAGLSTLLIMGFLRAHFWPRTVARN